MTAKELINNYSYAVDTSSIIFCVILSYIIRYVLYFSIDKKFKIIKRAIRFVFIGTVANILFAFTCEHSGSISLLYLFKAVNHISFMSCMFLYIMYLHDLLSINNKFVRAISHFTRLILSTCCILDLCSCFTEIGFCYTESGWKDSIFSFYNVFYIYGVFLLVCMLLFFNHRLIKSVRTTLIVTEVLIAIIMFKSAIINTNTYTSLTYILPIIVVLIILHSRPIDIKTGAMSYKSFESYIEKYCTSNISLDYLVLQLKHAEDKELPEELGKTLTTFWYNYYANASFFILQNGCFVLAVPRIKDNGNTLETMHKLFYDVFPKYYTIYDLSYKIIGLPDMNYHHSGNDIKHIVDYLIYTIEDNTILIADDKLKNDIKIMQNVKKHLSDIASKMDYDDERVLVYCQPIKNTKTGVYDTAEALMRLSSPEQGIISPLLVIPIAEEFGYIHMLTLIMINKVCKELNSLEKEGYEFERVSVNIALSELREPKFCEEIISIIKANGIDTTKIGIELTESQNDNDYAFVKEKIKILKESGMTIYLDDYGTGYSNFERVTKVGFDVIKYDKSILSLVQEDRNVSSMLMSFAESFKMMDYKILFEGVETQEHVEICNSCGADYLQGFKFSKPIPIGELRGFFKKN